MSLKVSSIVANKINAIQKSRSEDDSAHYFYSVEIECVHSLLGMLVKRMVKFDLNDYCKREFSSFKVNKLKKWIDDERKSHEVREFHRKKLQSLDTLEKRYVVGSLEIDIVNLIEAQLDKHSSFLGIGLFDLDKHFLKHLCFYQKQKGELVLIKDGNQDFLDNFIPMNEENTEGLFAYNSFIPAMGTAFFPASLSQEELEVMPEYSMVCSFNDNWQNNPKFRTRLFSKIDSVIEQNISRTFLNTLYKKDKSLKQANASSIEDINEIPSTVMSQKFGHKLPSAFYDRMSKHPRCKHGKASKPVYVALDKSGDYPYIETQSQQYQNILCVDIDNGKNRKDLLNRWKEKSVPAPSVIILNPKKATSAQYLYFLKVPLRTTSFKAVNYMKDVAHTLTSHLDGDLGYNGIFCKNPLFEGHEVVTPFSKNSASNSLDNYLFELKDFSSLEKVSRWSKDFSFQNNGNRNIMDGRHIEGRNNTLFNLGRLFGHQVLSRLKNDNKTSTETSFYELVFGYLISRNSSLYKINPLSINEVKGIAKSISQWQWKYYDANYAENLVQDETGLSQRDQHVIKVIEEKIQECVPLHQISDTLKLSLRRVKEYGQLILKKLYHVFKNKVIHNFGLSGRLTITELRQYITEWLAKDINRSYQTYVSLPSESTIKKWKKESTIGSIKIQEMDAEYQKDDFAYKLAQKRQAEREYSFRYRQNKAVTQLQEEQLSSQIEECKIPSKRTTNPFTHGIQKMSQWISTLATDKVTDSSNEKLNFVDFESDFTLCST